MMASATSQLTAMLEGAGLGSLAGMVWDLHRQGYDDDYIYNQIVESTTYKERFSGLVRLREQGVSAGMSEGDYLRVEKAMSDTLVSAGLGDTDFNRPEYLADAIANQVSVDEFGTRVQLAQGALTTLPADVREQFRTMYGVNQENLLAYYLDTDKVAADLEQQQRAASISAAYGRFQSPPVRREVFEELAARDVDFGDAARAFGRLGTLGAGLDDMERLEGAFGLSRSVDRERSGRVARFGGGGGAAATREGLTGLAGSAS